MTLEHFHYHSEEVKATPEGAQRNIVEIKNGRGSKSVVKYNAKGAVTQKKSKTLSSSEIKNIKGRKFMPGLFKDCATGKPMRPKTRKARK